jgi:uncharacterized protein (DUF2237 family)
MAGQLDDFCQMIKTKYGSPADVKPGDLARDFVIHSGLSSYPSFIEIHKVLKQYGVDEITGADLKAGMLKGHHFSYKGQGYQVQYEKDLWMGTVEHVMLHELYEIIAERCQDLCLGYRALPIPQICFLANRFAASALMQPEVVLEALSETGFDVVQLHNRFYKAYSSVAIRAIEVVNERNERKPTEESFDLMVMIYERTEEGDPREWSFCAPEKFVIRYSPRTKGIRLGTQGGSWTQGGRPRGPNYRAPRYPWHLIPKKGDGIMPDSLAMKVVSTEGCCCLQKATGFDLWGLNDLVFIAQPVKWFGKLAKVVLVGVRFKDSQLLEVQRDGLHKPTVIEESYQVI